MNTLNTIETRRSIRKFKNKDIDANIINELISYAVWAPSACNRQDWRFIVINDQALKNKIVDLGGAITIKSAPVVILALYSNQTANSEYNDHIQSAAAAIQNLLLAAHEKGLGGCWICHLPTKKHLRKLLNIPRVFDPVAAVLLGYPDIAPAKMPRKHQTDQVINLNSFNFPSSIQVSKDSFLRIRRVLIFFYQKTPLFIKKNIFNKLLDKKFVKKFKN